MVFLYYYFIWFKKIYCYCNKSTRSTYTDDS